MESNKTFVGLVIAFILILASIFLANIFNVIPDGLYNKIGSSFSYKGLIYVILLLVSVIALIMVYYRNSRENKDKSVTKGIEGIQKEEFTQKEIDDIHKKLLANLSKKEKDFLSLFMVEDTKTIRSDYARSDTANALVAQRIVYLPQQVSSHGSVSYVIQNWAWEILKKSPKYLE